MHSSNPLAAAAANITPFPNPRRNFAQSRYSKLDTKSVIAAEHRIELIDLLRESTTGLKAIYRSKFLFGDYLKFLDPNYSSDGAMDFNVPNPAPFESSFVHQKAPPKDGDDKRATDDKSTGKDSKKTAEELIRKLYRKNALLEIENRYLTVEAAARKSERGEASTGQQPFSSHTGQIPTHPLISRRFTRRNRSCPPTRVILRSAVAGAHVESRVTHQPSSPRHQEASAEKQGQGGPHASRESPGVTLLKQKVFLLLEALVASQHENSQLSKEKQRRISLRDALIKKYLVERDNGIAQLHLLLQEVLEKVQNPQRLSRVRQPAATMSPVVVGNNIMKEASAHLTEQVTQLTAVLLHQGSKAAQLHAPDAPASPGPGRKRELLRRVKTVVDGLPLSKKKVLLHLMLELQQINKSLVEGNAVVNKTYEDLKVRLSNDLVKEKLESALLRDRVRSLGGVVDEDVPYSTITMAQLGVAPNWTAAWSSAP